MPERSATMEQRASRYMPQEPYLLDAGSRQTTLNAIVEICSLKGWLLSAAHVRTTHVHVVAAADCKPEQVMVALKAYCSRALNLRDGLSANSRRRWTRHGSTRYLWTDVAIQAAIQYVVREQGEPMAVFEATPRFAQGSVSASA